MLHFEKLLNPSLLEDVLKGDDKAVSLALEVIHHKTLSQSHSGPKTFKEIMCNQQQTTTIAVSKRRAASPIQVNSNIFFSGIPDNITLKELWSIYKKSGTFKDIVLPRMRDRFNHMFGFIIPFNKQGGFNCCNL